MWELYWWGILGVLDGLGGGDGGPLDDMLEELEEFVLEAWC